MPAHSGVENRLHWVLDVIFREITPPGQVHQPEASLKNPVP
jgi:hypothetical protein